MNPIKNVFLLIITILLHSSFILDKNSHAKLNENRKSKKAPIEIAENFCNSDAKRAKQIKLHNTKHQIANGKTKSIKCDTIYPKAGQKIIAKVEDIGLEIIKYKKCNNLSGPSYSILKSEVIKIAFSNGVIEKLTNDAIENTNSKIENNIDLHNNRYINSILNFKTVDSISGNIFNNVENSYYLKGDGTLWSSGFDGEMQDEKGNNKYKLDLNPRLNPEIKQGKQICGAHYGGKNGHYAVLKIDGTVWAWGRNKRGQLGNRTLEDSEYPVQVIGLQNITKISMGEEFCLALQENGTVWAWGRNKYGQLGIGSKEDSNVPVKIPSLDNIVNISAGRFNSFAIKKDGTVLAWGGNWIGELDSTWVGKSPCILSPVICPQFNGAVSIQNHLEEFIMLKSDGTVWAFGILTYGDKGTQKTKRVRNPIRIQGIDNIVGIANGRDFSLALKNDGTVWAWGSNAFGQLGDSSISWHASYDEYVEKKLGGSKFLSVLLMSDNYVEDYFEPFVGSKGLNSFEKPLQVHGLKDIIAIHAGNDVAIAIKRDGTIWTWGSNYYGQLGIGTARPKYCNVPKKVNLTMR